MKQTKGFGPGVTEGQIDTLTPNAMNHAYIVAVSEAGEGPTSEQKDFETGPARELPLTSTWVPYFFF